MAKAGSPKPEPATPENTAGINTEMTPNTAKPRKARSPSIKYSKVVESAYKPTENPEAMHPLDKPAVTSRGGLKFPGVEFESTVFGVLVRIPAKSTIVKNPTIRQLLEVLDELYK